MIVNKLLLTVVCCLILVQTSFAATSCEGKTPDVAVVGAGIAGLTAALVLAKNGSCVIVFEAQSSVGGQVRNWDIGALKNFSKKPVSVVANGVGVSVGGSYFNLAFETTLKWLLEETDLISATYPPSSVNPFEYAPLVYPSVLASETPADYALFASLFEIGTLYPTLTTAPSEIQALQSVSVATWVEQDGYTANAKAMVTEFVYFQMSIDPSLIDAYSVAKYIAETVEYNAAEESFPLGATSALYFQLVGGTGQLTAALYELLNKMGVTFRLKRKVTRIVHYPNIIEVYAEGNTKAEVHKIKSNVIISVDPGLISNIEFEPKLTSSITSAVEEEAFQENVQYQVFAFFQSPWWFGLTPPRSPELVPTLALFNEIATDPKAPKIFGYASSVPPLVAEDESAVEALGVLRIMVPNNLYKSTAATLRDDVLDYLAYFNYTIPAAELLDVKVYNWNTVKSTRHGYFPISSLVNNLHSPYFQYNQGVAPGNIIIFANTENALAYNTLMEGAARAGYFAAEKAIEFMASSE